MNNVKTCRENHRAPLYAYAFAGKTPCGQTVPRFQHRHRVSHVIFIGRPSSYPFKYHTILFSIINSMATERRMCLGTCSKLISIIYLIYLILFVLFLLLDVFMLFLKYKKLNTFELIVESQCLHQRLVD